MATFKSAQAKQNHENAQRAAYAFRNSSEGQIVARHNAAVAAEQKAASRKQEHVVRELAREAIREQSRD